jgi:hypothetical protein
MGYIIGRLNRSSGPFSDTRTFCIKGLAALFFYINNLDQLILSAVWTKSEEQASTEKHPVVYQVCALFLSAFSWMCCCCCCCWRWFCVYVFFLLSLGVWQLALYMWVCVCVYLTHTHIYIYIYIYIYILYLVRFWKISSMQTETRCKAHHCMLRRPLRGVDAVSMSCRCMLSHC